mmetsp:Transcript_95146/g.268842  ORF Transcript_95146/g.268842 Transcript_95146/m.268842 type:complete len:225 (-) Transcript_95146:594-1268(-)
MLQAHASGAIWGRRVGLGFVRGEREPGRGESGQGRRRARSVVACLRRRGLQRPLRRFGLGVWLGQQAAEGRAPRRQRRAEPFLHGSPCRAPGEVHQAASRRQTLQRSRRGGAVAEMRVGDHRGPARGLPDRHIPVRGGAAGGEWQQLRGLSLRALRRLLLRWRHIPHVRAHASVGLDAGFGRMPLVQNWRRRPMRARQSLEGFGGESGGAREHAFPGEVWAQAR